jgi:hypothetical protein
MPLNQIPMDIFIDEYVSVCDTYRKHTLLDCSMGEVPHEAIIKSWNKARGLATTWLALFEHVNID